MRADINNSESVLMEYRLVTVPGVYVWFDGVFYKFDSNGDPISLVHLINRLITPLVTLKTEEDV